MKVATKHSTTMIQGQVESVEMRLTEKGVIAATRMFRDQIYTHKEWAVVREILCNAIDEHRKHNIDVPIRVTLPTMDDPHFRVRDFAKGLDKDGVFNVFFQYFASTKDASNDDIGGFGIGAKSPLAYSEIFFVDSFHGGRKTSYVANIDGEASTAHSMALADSTETGIEVSVPVDARDFDKFHNLVEYFVTFSNFQSFEFMGRDVTPIETDWTLNGDKWKVGKFKSPFESNSGIFAQISDVLYPIEQSAEFGNPFYHKLILEIDNGDVDIHPSRERLDLSKRNVFVIKSAIDKVKEESRKQAEAALASAHTAAEKFAASSGLSSFKTTLRNIDGLLPRMMTVGKSDLTWFKWDSSSIEKSDLKNYFSRWDSQRAFQPFMANIHEDTRWGTYKTPLGRLPMILAETTVRQEVLVAFCEKNNIPSPVVVIKNADAPQGWVEGSDFWTFNPESITKDEAKAVRDRLGLSRTNNSARQSTQGKIAGYTSPGRSSWGVETFDKLDTSKTYVLVPQEYDDADSVHYLAKNVVIQDEVLFVFTGAMKLWEKSGIKYQTWESYKKTLVPAMQKIIDEAAEIEASKGLSSAFLRCVASHIKPKYVFRASSQHIAASVETLFPDLKPNVSDVQQRWNDAGDAWLKLPAEDREFVTMVVHEDYYGRYPLMQAKAKKLLATVFV